MNINFTDNICAKIKSVRTDLKLNQNELAQELTLYCKVKDIRFNVKNLKNKGKLITFSQVDVSNIENNGSIIKEKIYIILSFYNIKYQVNLNFLFNSNMINTMYVHEKLLT